MCKYLFAVLAALTAGVALAFTPVAYTNSYVKDGVTYSQRGGLGTSNYVAVAVNALENNYTALTNNANFKAAVETVSPPAELPKKWALSNVTNNQGGAVSAINVSAFPLGAFIEEFNTSHQWNLGDFCLHNGQLWVAVDITRSGRPWDEDRWSVSTDYAKAMKKWLNTFYVDVGVGGTNIWNTYEGDYEKRIALGKYYNRWWHFNLLPDYFGMQDTGETEFIRLKPNGYSWKYDGATGDTNWRDIMVKQNIVPMNNNWFDPSLSVITSPYYIHAYLTNNYWQTWQMNDKYLEKPIAIRDYATYSAMNATNVAIRAEIASSKDEVKKLWNTDKTKYIDGEGYVWTQDPIHYAWSNEYGIVYNEDPENANTWVSPFDTRKTIVHLVQHRRFQYRYIDTIISQYPDSYPTRTVIQLQTQTGGDWETFYKFNTGNITYSKTEELVNTNALWTALNGYVPTTRTINGQDLTQDITIEGMTDNAVVWTNSTLKTKAGATVNAMDYQAMTNTVNAVKAEFYDEPLQVNWTVRMVNGEMKLYATTNVNMSTL